MPALAMEVRQLETVGTLSQQQEESVKKRGQPRHVPSSATNVERTATPGWASTATRASENGLTECFMLYYHLSRWTDAKKKAVAMRYVNECMTLLRLSITCGL